MSLIILSTVGILMVYQVSVPFNRLRRLLFGGILAAMLFSFVFLREMFSIHPLSMEATLLLAVFLIITYPLMRWLRAMVGKLFEKYGLFD